MQEGALTLSGDGEMVLYCNRCFAGLLGLPMEQIIGRSLRPYLEPVSEITFDDLLQSSNRKAEFELMAPDGHRVPVALSVSPVDAEDARTYCVLVADLTDQRDNERLRRAEQALLAADRRKDEFLAMLGHELRNPLAPIRMAVELIRSEVGESASSNLSKGLDIIDRQVSQMTRLVDDLLDVARITRGTVKLQQQVIKLTDVVATAVESIRPLIERHEHVLIVHAPAESIHVNVDPLRMAEVVTNLLHNAVKYTKEGGWIDVFIQRRDDHAEVVVRDTGMGIPPDLLPHVFDVFTQATVTLDRAQGGLGLGLTLVKRLVEMHGGTVRADSRGVDAGSEFTISLPLVSEPAGAASQAGSGPTDAESRSKRVLVVDDNADAAEMLGLLLHSRGHQVEIAHDGLAAIDLLEEFKPEVICLDIGLPHMDGYTLASKIRTLDVGKDVKLIAITGYGQEQDRARAVEAGFDHHLVKPIEPEVVYKLIE
jgi:PAS domain S-box-containing protein